MKKTSGPTVTTKAIETLDSPAMKALEVQSAAMKAFQAQSGITKIFEAQSAAMKAFEAQSGIMKTFEAQSTAMKAFEAQSGITKIFEAQSAAMKAFEAQSGITKIFEEQSAAMRAAQALIDSPSIKIFENLAAKHQTLFNELSVVEKLGGLAEIAGYMQHQPALALSVSTKASAIQRALYEFDRSPEDYDPVATEKLFDELIDGLTDCLEQAVEKIEVRSVIRFIWSVIPVILAFYFFQQSSVQIEKLEESLDRQNEELVDVIVKNKREAENWGGRLIDRLEKLENKIDELSDLQNPLRGTFYIVERTVPLTADQRFHGTVISWLLPGQEVELIDRSGKWIRVIAYDFSTGSTDVGWVKKKYLRRLQ
jgi:hypothetical protein